MNMESTIYFLGRPIHTGEEIISVILFVGAGLLILFNLDALTDFFLKINTKKTNDDNEMFSQVVLVGFALGLFLFSWLMLKDLYQRFF